MHTKGEFLGTCGEKAKLFLKVTHRHGPYNYKNRTPGQYISYDFVDRNGNLSRAISRYWNETGQDMLNLHKNECAMISGTVRHVVTGYGNVTQIDDARLVENFGRFVK